MWDKFCGGQHLGGHTSDKKVVETLREGWTKCGENLQSPLGGPPPWKRRGKNARNQ